MAMIGAIIGAVGTIVQAMGAAQQARYQSEVAKNNEIIAKQNAEYAIQAGKVEEEGYLMKAGAMIGEAKAVQGASGVDVNTGSPLSVRFGSEELKKLDALTIRSGAERSAYNFRSQAMNFAGQAELYKMEAQNSMLAGFLGGIGSIVGGMGSFAGKWTGGSAFAASSPGAGPVRGTSLLLSPRASASSPLGPVGLGPMKMGYGGYIPGGY